MNILKDLALAILEAKLEYAKDTLNREYPFLGEPHGFHIESIKQIERHPKGYLQFEVKTWDEISTEPNKTEILSFVEVQDLISRVAYLPTVDKVWAILKTD